VETFSLGVASIILGKLLSFSSAVFPGRIPCSEGTCHRYPNMFHVKSCRYIVSFGKISWRMAVNGQVGDVEMASVFICETCTWHTIKTAVGDS
jgi:hypothetical protein